MRPPHTMHGLSMAAGDSPFTHDEPTSHVSAHADGWRSSWREANAHGVVLAASGSWSDARDAFDSALHALTNESAPNVATHEAMALVLGNLAQACFRCGSVDDALRHAQRGCALRVALVGEDAVTVARARSDLAVMLAASGRIEEAPALLARAIAGIEQSAGDEDLRLAVVLENAARTALAAGQAANAEPHLIRLHALLGAHDLSTERADVLVSRIMQARSEAVSASSLASVQVDVPADLPAEVSRESHAEAAAVPALIESAPDEEMPAPHDDAEWDDQPLRDAVALTDVLLRTTPSGNVAVRAEPDARDPWTATPPDSMSEPDVFADAPLDLVELDVSGIDLVDEEAMSGGLERVGAQHAEQPEERVAVDSPIDAPAPAGLGFVVEYGMPSETSLQQATPERSYEPPAIRGSDAITRDAVDQSSQFDPDGDQNVDLLTPPGASVSLGFGSDFELVAETAHASSQLPADDAPQPTASPTAATTSPTLTADASPPAGQVERRKTPRAVSVVMPSPAGGAPVMQSTMTDRDDVDLDAAAGGAPPASAAGGHAPRSAPRVGTRLAKEPSGSGRGIAIGSGIALLAAAAGWYFLSGNF